MATYEITAPGGGKYQVTAPDDATEEQVLAYAQRNSPEFKQGYPKPPEFNREQPFLPYAEDVAKKFLTGTVGFPIDAINSALGTAGLPVSQRPVGGSKQLQQFVGYRGLKPSGTEAKVGGEIVGNVAASIPYAGFAARGGKITPAIAELLGGAGMGLGGSLGQMADHGNVTAEVTGQLLGGASGFRAGNMTTEALKAWSARNAANPALRQSVFNSARKEVAGTIQKAIASEDPKEIEAALKRYRELQEVFPEFRAGVGDITGNEALLSMQREGAAKDISALELAGQRARANTAAVREQKILVVPESPARLTAAIYGTRSGLTKQLSEIDTQLASLDRQVGARNTAIASRSLDLPQAGEALGVLRQGEFTASRAKAAKKYDDFRISLGADTSKPVDATGVTDAISVLRQEDPAAQRMPSLFRTVDDISARRTQQPPTILGPNGQPIQRQAQNQMQIDDLLSVQKAIGKDLRFQRVQQPPDREAIRRLQELDNNVDQAIRGNVSKDALGFYDEARRFYREEHVPRFFEGVNYKQALPNVYGDLRIRPEALVDEYARNTTNAKHFNTLYGNSPTGRAALQAGFLEKYKLEVLERGGGPRLHAQFTAKYRQALQEFPWVESQFRSEGIARGALDSQQAVLRDQAANIAKSRIAQVVGKDTVDQVVDAAMQSPQNMGNFIVKMPKDHRQAVVTAVMDRGWNILQSSGVDAFERWMKENNQVIRTAVFGAYGKTMAEKHFSNIQDMVDISRILERNPVQKISTQAVRQAEDPVKQRFGAGATSIFAAARAVGQRRVSPEYTGGVFLGQFVNKLRKDEYLKLVQQTLYEPETLDAFIHAAKTNSKVDLDKIASKASDIFATVLGKGVPTQLFGRLPQYGQGTDEE